MKIERKWGADSVVPVGPCKASEEGGGEGGFQVGESLPHTVNKMRVAL